MADRAVDELIVIDQNNLAKALANDEIWPAFQPLCDLRSNTVVGFEVLARWTSPILGAIRPDIFIPVAEASGLIDAVTERIVSIACRQAQTWSGTFTLAFNISPTQFRDPELFEFIRRTASASGFPLARIEIEVTESALLEDDKIVRKTIDELKRNGIGLGLDDFGTGYASLSRLHAFPFSKLKIDTSFVRTMETDGGSRKIVASVIGLGQSLGMTVVAEGVETEQQAAMLRRLGCDVGQGWLFGRPQQGDDAACYLLRHDEVTCQHRSLNVSPFQRLHQLDTLYKSAPIGLSFLDTDLYYVSLNDRFANMLGARPSDVVGRKVYDFIPSDEAVRMTAIFEQLLAGHTVATEERTSASGVGTFLIIGQRVDDDGGEPIGISVAAVDISERKALETALRESEDHVRQSMELSPSIVWSADAEGKVNYMGPTIDDTRELVADRIADWYDRMHPEDSVRVRREWLDWLGTGMKFETKFRIRFREGSWRWMSSRAKPHRDANGKIIKWYGVITDIHEQEALAARIGELEYKLANATLPSLQRGAGSRAAVAGMTDRLPGPIDDRSLEIQHGYLTDALSNMADGIAIYDQDGFLLFINRQYSELFPVTADVRQPGRHFLDILQASIDRGEEPSPGGLLEEWKQRVFANLKKPGARLMAFSDGRCIEARWGVSSTGHIFVNYSDLTKAKQSERMLTELNAQLKTLATTDGLTGLANRRRFDEAFSARSIQTRAECLPLSLLLIDVDRFKAFNDTYGHQAGDDCLRKIASVIQAAANQQDVLAARYGGEEIAVILPGANLAMASLFANNLRTAINALAIAHNASDTGIITVSIGVATDNRRGGDTDTLVATADRALYRAKEAGRDCIKTCTVDDDAFSTASSADQLR